jgi:Protein of unknown function (DUF2794)
MRRQNARIIVLGDYRDRHRPLYFTRSELNMLLGLYTRHVARGEWRDYAIDQGEGMALFSVFRHSLEGPAYRIVKTAGAATEFVVLRGRRRVRAAASLAAALAFFDSPLSLVPAAAF